MESWKIKFFKDRDMMQVFASIHESSKTAKQISDECNIPKSTVYKKLKKLQDKNLVSINYFLHDGSKNKIYKKRLMKVNNND